MYYLKLVLLLFVTATLINVNGVFAQDINRTNNWIFGVENSLHFSSTGGVTSNSNSSITASEATASISDKNGDLLFYTDGMYVWNRNHHFKNMCNVDRYMILDTCAACLEICPYKSSQNTKDLLTHSP